jgi:hypothetical protein
MGAIIACSVIFARLDCCWTAMETADLNFPDDSRRFGGIARLYGEAGRARLADARVCVVGIGGVGLVGGRGAGPHRRRQASP